MAGLPGTMTKVILLVFLLLDFAGWVISLAGLAKLTDMCRKEEGPWSSSGGALSQIVETIFDNTEKNRAYDCGVTFSLHWWIVFLQFLVVIVGLLGSFSESLHSKHIFLHILAVSTTLYCLFAENYVRKEYVVMNDSNDYMKATAAAAAGAIIVLTTNFIVAFLYGKENPPTDAQAPIESKA